jgi:uncharacterized protein Yka (UPF0111/DUF47 family)
MAIGENIYLDLKAAGLTPILNYPISLLTDLTTVQAVLTPAQVATLNTVLANHVPRELTATERFERDIDRMDETILRAIFNHENRIRALEAKPAINRAQFLAGLKALTA